MASHAAGRPSNVCARFSNQASATSAVSPAATAGIASPPVFLIFGYDSYTGSDSSSHDEKLAVDDCRPRRLGPALPRGFVFILPSDPSASALQSSTQQASRSSSSFASGSSQPPHAYPPITFGPSTIPVQGSQGMDPDYPRLVQASSWTSINAPQHPINPTASAYLNPNNLLAFRRLPAVPLGSGVDPVFCQTCTGARTGCNTAGGCHE